MKISILWMVSLLSLILSGLSWGNVNVQHVIILSIDGGKPSVIQESSMPYLKKVVLEGAHTWNAKTITPSITLPSHTSMLTGVGPEIHQVLWNDWIPEKGLVQVPTVFDLAQAQGYKTAFFASKDKFRHLHVPAIQEFQIIAESAPRVATPAGEYFVSSKPNLTFVHFRDADQAGHAFGWGSIEQKKALEQVDQGIQILLASIQKSGVGLSTVLMITADHGGTGLNHGEDTEENRTIPWIIWGASIKSGYEIYEPVHTTATAATALNLLGVKIPDQWQGKAVTSVRLK